MSTAGMTTPSVVHANSNGGATATATETANGNSSNGNTNGSSNPTRRSGGCGRFQSRNSGGGSTFKGSIPSIDTLAMKAKKRGIEFASFIKSLHQHVITAYSNPKDVASQTPSSIWHQVYPHAVHRKQGLHPEKPTANESTTEETAEQEDRNEEQVDMVREL